MYFQINVIICIVRERMSIAKNVGHVYVCRCAGCSGARTCVPSSLSRQAAEGMEVQVVQVQQKSPIAGRSRQCRKRVKRKA